MILGLTGVKLSEAFPGLNFLHKADAVAALVVACIVIYVSVQPGRRRKRFGNWFPGVILLSTQNQ